MGKEFLQICELGRVRLQLLGFEPAIHELLPDSRRHGQGFCDGWTESRMLPRSLGIALRWAAAADGRDFGSTGAVIPVSASVDVEASAAFVLGLSVAGRGAVFGTGATGW